MLSYRHNHGLLRYDNSYNLGDEIQSIAAKQFLTSVDYTIDRDTSRITNLSDDGTTPHKLRVIYNGWFDGQYCQFPPPDTIDPLFISFHINETDHSNDKSYSYLNDRKINLRPIADNVSYLKQFEPIGCRDYHTVNMLTRNGIECYFSGCLTLTLTNRFTTRNDEILVVDCHLVCKGLFESLIPESIRNQAVYISQAVDRLLPHAKKMELAQQHLDRLARAKLVITSRLHTAMPCLAFKTPIIFIHPDLHDVRFQGLVKYVKSYTHGDHVNIDLLNYRNPDNPELTVIANNLRMSVNRWLHKDPYKGLDGYSIISACMNREAHLEKTLPTWLAANPNEIIIVDWGSKTSIKPIIDRYNVDGKIILVTVTNVDKWVLTKAFNLAARFSKYACLLKLDCDDLLDKNFFAYHDLKNRSVFFAGDWKKARNENEKHTNGVIYMRREDFFRAGGYNEFITTYGYDDCDLYRRLEKHSERLLINLDLLKHLAHTNIDRFINQSLGRPYRLDIEIEKNRLISEKNLWKGVFSTFDVKKMSQHHYRCEFQYGVELYDKMREQLLDIAVKNREYYTEHTPAVRRFYIVPKNGLGNRLRAVASAYNIAKETGRQLIIVWTPDSHCSAKFSDLFKLNYLFNGVSIIDDANDVELQHVREYQINESGSVCDGKTIYNYMIKQNQYIDDTVATDIYVISACVLNNSHTDWSKDSRLLQRLEPVDDVAAQIYDFETKHCLEKAIGVHIRMGQPMDTSKYEDTSKWTPEARSSIERWRTNSHFLVFAQEMDRIIAEYPDQVFFLCCDNEFIYDELRKMGKYKLIHTKKTVYDRSCDQIKSGVADLYLLAKTSYILGSNWSSFTEVAHRLNGRALKLAGVDFK